MNGTEKVLDRIAHCDNKISALNERIKHWETERSEYIEENKELFCPVKVGQQIMFCPDSRDETNWGKVEVQRFDCQIFPHSWNVRVKLIDIPKERKSEGSLLWVTVRVGGSDWKTLENFELNPVS